MRLIALALVLLLAGCTGGESRSLRAPELVVILKQERASQREMVRLRAAYRVRIGYPCSQVHGFAIYARPGVLPALSSDPAVDYVWPNKRAMRRLCEG